MLKPKNYFQSLRTTQMNRSKHYIADFSLYEESIYKSFEQFIEKLEDYIFRLLPNYSENPHSSLIYMIDFDKKVKQTREWLFSLQSSGICLICCKLYQIGAAVEEVR